MSKHTLVLVDGSSYLYRAFHALPSLTNSKGQATGAIHGVAAMLRRLHAQYTPAYFAVVFDPRGRTTRDAWYADYKAHRPSMPDDLATQVPPLFELIDAMGYPRIVVDGVEADDVIGTLARRAAAQGLAVVISTGDKDLAQLVTPDITLVNTMDDSVLDEAGVRAKFGVGPDQIIDYLTLVGDAVDNIPGVPKVGPKTAVKWLAEYRTLDGVIAHAADIPGKIGENLREAIPKLPLSRKLVTVIDDVPLDVAPEKLVTREADTPRLVALLTELEFKSWLKQIGPEVEAAPAADAPAAVPRDYETVFTEAQLEAWLATLRQAPLFAFDTETTSLDYMQARIVGVSFCREPGRAAYVPLAHDYPGAPDQLDRDTVLARLKPLLEDPAHAKVGHNLKYDREVLLNHGIDLQGIRYDTMLESYTLNSTASRHDLDTLALDHLGVRTIHYEDVAGKGAKQLSFNDVPVETAGPYAAEDADVCLQLHAKLWPRIEAEPELRRLFEEIEMPLLPVIARLERNGVLLDVAMLRAQSAELARKLIEVEAAAHEAAGQPFNLGSPKQIQEILFEKLGLPVKEKTPTGQPSTAESVLAELALDYPLPKLILEHRAVAKLKSTYTDKLPEEVDRDTGRVHTSYHQAVAATGRLSSSDPNLQNIPVRTPEGRRIRQAFIAPAGRVLLAADYSQIELRIMAHLSRDERLLEAFASGLDVHRATAAEVFGLPPAEVADEQRRAAKAINFGLIYGMSAFGLARQLGLDRGAAQQYVDRYFARYPGVKRYMDDIRAQAHERGYVETVFKRRLYLPEINSRNVQRRQYAERTAINAPMQGTAADIIKRAMIAVDAWLVRERVPALMIMQVHDELVLEVDIAAAPDVAARLCELMAGAAELSVPLVVDIGTGANWDEAH
ncbi:MAG: DNA polymerase I [Gammaproteobacteria bacterium]|nr:DNA polymerase I [Gammaproteobacteria bacterium]